MDNTGRTIAATIRKLRASLNLTQHELAEKAGISFSGLQDIEYEKVTPRAATISKISRALGVSEAALFNGSENNVYLFNNIRKLRKNACLTLDHAADKLKISTDLLIDFERNKITPNSETLEKICALFGVPMNELLYFEVTPGQLSKDEQDELYPTWMKIIADVGPDGKSFEEFNFSLRDDYKECKKLLSKNYGYDWMYLRAKDQEQEKKSQQILPEIRGQKVADMTLEQLAEALSIFQTKQAQINSTYDLVRHKTDELENQVSELKTDIDRKETVKNASMNDRNLSGKSIQIPDNMPTDTFEALNDLFDLDLLSVYAVFDLIKQFKAKQHKALSSNQSQEETEPNKIKKAT